MPVVQRSVLLASLLAAVASARIAATYPVFSFTIDEPGHFACGLEFLSKHVYRYETQHPPLARAMIALGPYLAGIRPLNDPNRNVEGRLVMLRSGHLERTLTLMRAGILPFFWLACAIVYLWSRRYFDETIALTATGLFTLLPPILAHAGLACTDMALAAVVGAAFYALVRWAERPGWKRGAMLGAATGLAVLTKFTALVYLPSAAAFAALFYLVTVRPPPRRLADWVRERAPSFAAAIFTGALVIWGGYWFSFGKVPVWNISLPAPEFFDGLRDALSHNQGGHPAYLLGKYSLHGWWYYFPLALGVKTPLPFLGMALFGIFCCARNFSLPGHRLLLAFGIGILLPAMAGHVDIGVRLILPLYIAMAILAAVGFVPLIRGSAAGRVIAALLLLWLVAAGALRHPDYLSYFNELAGSDPAKVLVDSDLDWGQDTKRLATRLRELDPPQVSLMLIEPLTWQLAVEKELQLYYRLPRILPADASAPHEGWTAISPTVARTLALPFTPWYDKVPPTEKVGALWLYHFPVNGAVRP